MRLMGRLGLVGIEQRVIFELGSLKGQEGRRLLTIRGFIELKSLSESRYSDGKRLKVRILGSSHVEWSTRDKACIYYRIELAVEVNHGQFFYA